MSQSIKETTKKERRKYSYLSTGTPAQILTPD